VGEPDERDAELHRVDVAAGHHPQRVRRDPGRVDEALEVVDLGVEVDAVAEGGPPPTGVPAGPPPLER